jgi:hypothetical protein
VRYTGQRSVDFCFSGILTFSKMTASAGNWAKAETGNKDNSPTANSERTHVMSRPLRISARHQVYPEFDGPFHTLQHLRGIPK